MKKKQVFALTLVFTLLVSIISVPAFAVIAPTFSVDGKFVLPGNEVAPDGGLLVSIICRSDMGTTDTSDDNITNSLVVLMKDAHEADFSTEIPYSTATNSRFTLSYSISSASGYWEQGYYSSSGMQYYSEGQSTFNEGPVSGLVLTPIKAVTISGTVSLPSYSDTQTVDLDISAKTLGILPGSEDDFEAKAAVSIAKEAATYQLRVPSTISDAAYTVMYITTAAGYEKQGWYSELKTSSRADSAVKVDVSGGSRADINLQLVEAITPPPPVAPDDKNKFDLNKDGKVDIKDQIMISRAMGSLKKFAAHLDINKDGVINVKDLKLIKEELKKVKKNKQRSHF